MRAGRDRSPNVIDGVADKSLEVVVAVLDAVADADLVEPVIGWKIAATAEAPSTAAMMRTSFICMVCSNESAS